MANDYEIRLHQSWIGLVQPRGLVVSAPALVKAAMLPKKDVVAEQALLVELLYTSPEGDVVLDDFPTVADRLLGWDIEDLAGAPGGPTLPVDLTVALTDYHDTLAPTYALRDPMGDEQRWLLLVQVVTTGATLDKPLGDRDVGWHASPQARFERLLRETSVPAGLLSNGTHVRLVYAPRGESSGHITFPVDALVQVRYRELLAALLMLLHGSRVIDAQDGARLLDILADSRKYQNEVSNRLADQVLDALWELLRGLQAADAARTEKLLGELVRDDPAHVYGGLITVLMRLVFLLYAEDEELLPRDAVFAQGYSVSGLYERLRDDAGRYPDTMDERRGAWAALLSLFRLVYDGGGHGVGMRLPARHGQLFDPGQYPFLEGRQKHEARQAGFPIDVPKVPDGCVHRVLERLLILDGERLSYRALDVEQIGSVYEAIMGFEVERAFGPALAIAPKHIVVDLGELLAEPAGKRVKWLEGAAQTKLTGNQARDLKTASTVDEVVAALGSKVSPRTPRPLQAGSLYLQPGEERRRSGSHYTPRELTEPIVRTTLRPVLEDLGPKPTPEQILDLKVCDLAMGSGAFLVETDRQLAETLVEAWDHHGDPDDLPPGVERLTHARRLVAQRCLYGVDKNPFAVNLAKLSLWLITLARDLPFTFIDHALKHGDSLVGLTLDQIERFDWEDSERDGQIDWVEGKAAAARVDRDALRVLGDRDERRKLELLEEAEAEVREARLVGDLCVAAFFDGGSARERKELRGQYRTKLDTGGAAEVVAALRGGERPVPPLHWELEFPEVFGRERPGFDAVVGNPPFAGKNTTGHGNRLGFIDWIMTVHGGSHGNADLVAHFFRRAFALLRGRGAFGLIATNTIGQGDTRDTGLTPICRGEGHIYAARRRVVWPGGAAVIVSVVHIQKAPRSERQPCRLDGRAVARISAFLFHAGGDAAPARLFCNADTGFMGVKLFGKGFVLSDAERSALVTRDERNARFIKPYLPGFEINRSPSPEASSWVINFEQLPLKEARRWPDLVAIADERVRPERLKNNRSTYRTYWWRLGETGEALYRALSGQERCLICCQVSANPMLTWAKAETVFPHTVCVFALSSDGGFALLQSRAHEGWARFFGSSMKDDLRYTPSDCFETFPFPPDWTTSHTLEAVGEAYHTFRADLMVRNDEGLTKTYNRFHDPDEHDPDIVRLRELHAEMDRAVLDAYGWTDVPTDCEFLLDYEIDEETWGKKKKPYRYRWPDDVRDEVLARLLELNKQRAEEEALAGKAGKAEKKSTTKRQPKKATKAQGSLF